MNKTFIQSYLQFTSPSSMDNHFIFMLGAVNERFQIVTGVTIVLTQEEVDDAIACYYACVQYLITLGFEEPKEFMNHCSEEVEHFFVSRAEANM